MGWRKLGIVIGFACGAVPATAIAEWRAVERVETYAISGQSGLDLYKSIGAHGPKVGPTRVIAHTSFKLTWTRRYRATNGTCAIPVAKPKLVITYVVPKPSPPLSGTLARHWKTFIDGVLAHEKVHGQHIIDMVHEIQATSLGLSVADDPDCTKIRAELTRRLGMISQAQRARGREFDRIELGADGNIGRLVLDLVNGG